MTPNRMCPPQITTARAPCFLSNATAEIDSGSGDSGSGGAGTSLADLGGNFTEGRRGTVCDILGQGSAWCNFLRFAVQFFNALAIIWGLIGDVLSDKVYATRVSLFRSFGQIVLLFALACWVHGLLSCGVP